MNDFSIENIAQILKETIERQSAADNRAFIERHRWSQKKAVQLAQAPDGMVADATKCKLAEENKVKGESLNHRARKERFIRG